MSDDLLRRAADALREETDPDARDPAMDRALRRRVLATVAERQRLRARRLSLLLPIAAVFVASLAVAAATGAFPEAVDALRDVLGLGHEATLTPAWETAPRTTRGAPSAAPSPVHPAPGREVDPAPVAAVEPPPVPAPPAPAAIDPDPAQPLPRLQPDLPPTAPRATALRKPPSASSRPPMAPPPDAPAQPTEAASPTPQPSPPPAAPSPAPSSRPDSALALFREAQRLHHTERSWSRALVAWNAYLAAAPDGVLVPEARWSRAICLVRLGRKAEARAALEPFARGASGSYRQTEARELLDALDVGEH